MSESVYREWRPGMRTPSGRLTYVGAEVFRACNSEIVEREPMEGERLIVKGWFSTNEPDIDNFEIDGPGWHPGLKTYKERNPMFLWMHDPYQPIGRTVSADTAERGLFGATEFDGEDDLALKLYRKTRNKFLGTYSVGFRALEEPRFEDDRIIFGKRQLMEVSLVSIPANINAVVTERALDEEALCQRMVTLAGDKWTLAADQALAEFTKRANAEMQRSVEDIRKGLVLDVSTAIEERLGTVAQLVKHAVDRKSVLQALDSFKIEKKG